MWCEDFTQLLYMYKECVEYTTTILLQHFIFPWFFDWWKIPKKHFQICHTFGVKHPIAICSQNCVQIWKGRDRKTAFCRVRHKKCRVSPILDIFFYVKPCKQSFFDQNLSLMRKKFREHIFLCQNYTFV